MVLNVFKYPCSRAQKNEQKLRLKLVLEYRRTQSVFFVIIVWHRVGSLVLIAVIAATVKRFLFHDPSLLVSNNFCKLKN